jgi:Protein of unknown function (DUF2851)
MMRDVSTSLDMTAGSVANRYAEMRDVARVHERELFPLHRVPSELELQARWFAGDFGRHFVATNGDKIDIVQFGVWNREAGPDFSDAAIRVNGSEPIRGSIEFDLTNLNWETHGHAANPAFESAVLHVFVHETAQKFFTRTLPNREVLQLRVDPNALPETFTTNIPLARPGRCQAPLKELAEERVRSVLDAAAQFRLQRKAARLRSKIDNCQSGSDHGRDEALFQEIAAALGYKQNKLPFTLLAQRLPLKLLRENFGNCEALLFGAAGFLDTPDLDVFAGSTRGYVRQLWDKWWPQRDALQRFVLSPKTWRLSSTRPLNHPQRRVAALATLAREWPRFQRLLGKRTATAANDFFAALEHPFWNFHYTLATDPAAKPLALIGDSRVADILANVLFPFWFGEDATVWTEYKKLPAQLSNRRVETAATRLFGDNARRREFTKTLAQQQALLQIYEDFCLQDNSDCAQCPFPEQMRKWNM